MNTYVEMIKVLRAQDSEVGDLVYHVTEMPIVTASLGLDTIHQ